VYFIYGASYMLNVTAEEPGVGAGVLLRAIEPLEGINLMKRLRKTGKLRDLARGPGRLAAALQIDQRLDGVDLCASGPLWLGTAFERLRTLAQLCASASRVRWTGCCVSSRWTAHSLAAP
jgi:3-methyladenine DNA glycosylase Mpg